MKESKIHFGWVYELEVIQPDGSVENAVAYNAVFDEGIHNLVDHLFIDPRATDGFYIALLTTAFTAYDNKDFKMVNMTTSMEYGDYTGATRPLWVPTWVPPKATNVVSKANVTFGMAAELTGIMLTNESGIHDFGGVALSAGRFGEGNIRVAAGATANITATLTVTSA